MLPSQEHSGWHWLEVSPVAALGSPKRMPQAPVGPLDDPLQEADQTVKTKTKAKRNPTIRWRIGDIVAQPAFEQLRFRLRFPSSVPSAGR